MMRPKSLTCNTEVVVALVPQGVSTESNVRTRVVPRLLGAEEW